jgi:hypothetical protein
MQPMPRSEQLPPWEHGIPPYTLWRLKLMIPSLQGHYERLDKASGAVWGIILSRYAVFQQLRRQAGESGVNHRARRERWLLERGAFERERHDISQDVRAALPQNSPYEAGIALGTWIASPEQIAGSELEHIVPAWPTGRVVVLDVAADKELLKKQIFELIDRERKAAGIAPASRRGPPKQPKTGNSEQREFLKGAREHQIIRLWDLQIADTADQKLKTARALYPALSEKRSLLAKLNRAEELQQEALAWIPRLCAAGDATPITPVGSHAPPLPPESSLEEQIALAADWEKRAWTSG